MLESDIFAGTSQVYGTNTAESLTHPVDMAVGVVEGGVSGPAQSFPILPVNGHSNHGNSHDIHGDVHSDSIFYNHQVEDQGRNIVNFLASPKLVQPLPLPVAQGHASQQESQYSLKQLEVLYKAKKRQVEELTQQFTKEREDGEMHVRILREEKVS